MKERTKNSEDENEVNMYERERIGQRFSRQCGKLAFVV